MNVTFLKWDSDFFGLNISKIEISNSVIQKSDLNFNGNDLFYVFSNIRQPGLESAGAQLVDTKLTFGKKITNPSRTSGEVFSYQGPVSEQLVALGIASGWASRFNIDDQLKSKFKDLYKLWIKNSISRAIADEVLVVEDNEVIVGLVTFKKIEKTGKIGILAVSEVYRGKGLGSKLVHAADDWYYKAGLTQAEVVTQERNLGACRFYENNGYTVKAVEYVYHVWK
jgi:dTDP-4-amino-4,6-dideoxy-D-galactose acyltransferase